MGIEDEHENDTEPSKPDKCVADNGAAHEEAFNGTFIQCQPWKPFRKGFGKATTDIREGRGFESIHDPTETIQMKQVFLYVTFYIKISFK